MTASTNWRAYMTLSPKEALLATSMVWKAMCFESLFRKEDVKWAEIFAHNCPCCQYTLEQLHQNGELQEEQKIDMKTPPMWVHQCEKYCPMWKQWGSEFCEHGRKSPYKKWRNFKYRTGYEYDLQFFALLISELASEAIEEAAWDKQKTEAPLKSAKQQR